MYRLFQINRVKHLLDRSTLSLVIHSLVLSKLFYCSSVWSNTSKENVKKMQLVQNFAARIIVGLRKFDHVTPALKELKWLNVSNQLYLKDAVLVFKSKASSSFQAIQKAIEAPNHNVIPLNPSTPTYMPSAVRPPAGFYPDDSANSKQKWTTEVKTPNPSSEPAAGYHETVESETKQTPTSKTRRVELESGWRHLRLSSRARWSNPQRHTT